MALAFKLRPYPQQVRLAVGADVRQCVSHEAVRGFGTSCPRD